MLEVGKLFYYDTLRGDGVIPVLILGVSTIDPYDRVTFRKYHKVKMLKPDGKIKWGTYPPGDLSTRFRRIYT